MTGILAGSDAVGGRGHGALAAAISSTVLAVAAGLAGSVRAEAQPPRAYVANQQDATVSVIDLDANAAVATVDLQALGYPAIAKPHHTAVEPDGSFWYVSLIGAGEVLKFDRSNSLVASAAVEVPGLLALHPTEELLLAGRSMSAVNPPSTVAVIRRSDMRLLEEIEVVIPRPHALALHPSGEFAYVGSLGENRLATIQLPEGSVRLIDVDGPPHSIVQFAVSPDGSWLVGTAQLTARLLVFALNDAAAPILERSVPVNAGPWHPAFTPDGRTVWFGNLSASTITAVDVASWEVEAVLEGEGIGQPHGIAVAADGRHVYVSSRHRSAGGGSEASGPGTVVVICSPTRAVEAILDVGSYAAGMSATSSPAAYRSGPSGSCR